MSEYYQGYTSICSYISNHNETCSFREFVDLYKEMIIDSPPNTDDWSGLETAWEMRFLRSVKDIIPEKYDDIHAKVKSEISNKSLMYHWQNIVNEKGQKSVINNHISGSLKILDATAKHNVNTTNTNADDDDGDFISSNKSTISRSHWKDTSSSNLQSLESAGSSIGDTKMMDEVNNPGYNRPHTPPHQIYSTSENQNLLTQLRNEKQRAKSTIDTRNDLRNKLLLPFIPSGETYSFSKHYEVHWVHRFADKLSLFFEAPRNPLLDKNSEGWLNCHIFAPLIDDCFLICEEIHVHRCEEMSLASIMRKNLTREESEKKSSGHKIDIIFRVDDRNEGSAGPTSKKVGIYKRIDQRGKKYLRTWNVAWRYRIGTTWSSVPDSLMTLKKILCLKCDINKVLGVIKKVKRARLYSKPEDLFSINNLPDTTPSPKKKQNK
ncbi:13237_t:CDS:10 [Funneliformis geosporum]|uniref:13237_t:CDS:1 n=1 Tax=Funneliformis geosporum TaxID=1117311 RepID=A0A9W4T228_9GLOM|nr:13237_t:CDS:10 [Funneliformis geosporum]